MFGKPARKLALQLKRPGGARRAPGRGRSPRTCCGDGDGQGAGTVAFTLGLLHARQTEAAAAARAEFRGMGEPRRWRM